MRWAVGRAGTAVVGQANRLEDHMRVERARFGFGFVAAHAVKERQVRGQDKAVPVAEFSPLGRLEEPLKPGHDPPAGLNVAASLEAVPHGRVI